MGWGGDVLTVTDLGILEQQDGVVAKDAVFRPQMQEQGEGRGAGDLGLFNCTVQLTPDGTLCKCRKDTLPQDTLLIVCQN